MSKDKTQLISVIVPVYNVEPYVEKCINSILQQTYQNIELLLVDDGSTDNSGAICDSFAKKDDRIRVLHQSNGGVSVARNVGLKNARGEFVLFVDADDYADEDMCSELLSVAIETNADIVFSDFYYDNDTRVSLCSSNDNRVVTLSDQQDILFMVTDFDNKAGINVWAKLFNRSKISNIWFKNGTPLGEDQLFVFEAVLSSKRVSKINKPFYHYVMRDGSAMHQQVNVEKERKLLDVYADIEKKLRIKNNEHCMHRFIVFRLCQCELSIVNKMVKCNCNNKALSQELCRNLRKNIKHIILSDAPILKKCQFILCGYAHWCYRLLFRLL